MDSFNIVSYFYVALTTEIRVIHIQKQNSFYDPYFFYETGGHSSYFIAKRQHREK